MGQRGSGARTAGASERTQDVDRAPALQRLGRQADARRARRADGRGRNGTRRALLAETQAKRAPAAVPTVRTFAPAFLADCAERWKPATRRANADGMSRFIVPAFGDRRVDAVTEGCAQLV